MASFDGASGEVTNPIGDLPMRKLTLYCKSFSRDILRAQRLAESVDRYNHDALPFYISVPSVDLSLFQEKIGHTAAILIADELILATNPAHDLAKINQLPGGLSQQIIKSEFWRLRHSECYVCLDSDCEFIRDFFESDFVAPDGSPYTVMNEAKELLEFCDRHHYPKVRDNFFREAADIQQLFERFGKAYSFGMPAVWSAQVWQALEREMLVPQGISLADLVVRYPHELRLYGETLLKYRPVLLVPCDYLFKIYFYEQQYDFERKLGYSDKFLALNWIGVLKQSNWDGKHHGVRKSIASRTWKNIKRLIRNVFL
jgi:hypothetical protein